MKNVFLFFVLISSIGFTQNIPFKLLKSQEFEDEYKKSNIVLNEKDQNGNFLVVRSFNTSGLKSNHGIFIETFDANLKLLRDFEFEITHPLHEKYNTIIGVSFFDSKVNIIELFYDLKQKFYICQANTISNDFIISKKELFRLSNDEVKKHGKLSTQDNSFKQKDQLLEFDNSGDINSEVDDIYNTFFNFDQKFSMIKDDFVSNIVMVTNDTKTNFSIAIDFYGTKSELLKLYMFDDKLNLRFETDFKKEIDDKKYFFQNIQVSPEGNAIYLLGKSYSKEFSKKEKGGKYQFELTRISANNQETQIINPDEHYISSLKTIFKNNQLICLGFYSDLKENTFQGISYFSFDPNSLALLRSKYNPFSDQFIIDKYGEKKDKGLKYLVFKDVFLTTKNELIINAEEQYIRHYNGQSYAFGGSSGSSTSYNYDDIICAKLNSDGALLWARNINKRQGRSDEQSFISYSVLNKNESSYFFINTGEEIKKLSNNRIEFGQVGKNKSNLNVIKVNSDGDFDFIKILDDENTSVPFMVSKGFVIDKSVLFLGRKGKTKQLLKVTLD